MFFVGTFLGSSMRMNLCVQRKHNNPHASCHADSSVMGQNDKWEWSKNVAETNESEYTSTKKETLFWLPLAISKVFRFDRIQPHRTKGTPFIRLIVRVFCCFIIVEIEAKEPFRTTADINYMLSLVVYLKFSYFSKCYIFWLGFIKLVRCKSLEGARTSTSQFQKTKMRKAMNSSFHTEFADGSHVLQTNAEEEWKKNSLEAIGSVSFIFVAAFYRREIFLSYENMNVFLRFIFGKLNSSAKIKWLLFWKFISSFTVNS